MLASKSAAEDARDVAPAFGDDRTTAAAGHRTATVAGDRTAALTAYGSEGLHVEPDVFTAAEIRALNAAADRVSAKRGGTLAPMMNPHREEAILLQKALRHPRIVAIVGRLVGGRVHGLQSQYFFCPPGTPGFSRHQDNFYVRAKPDAFVSVWCALSDVDSENGGLVFLPRSHREPILPVELVRPQRLSPTQDPNANRRQTLVPPGYAPFRPRLPAGSAVFFHGHTVHWSEDNRSAERWRRSLLLTYLRVGETFRPGGSGARSIIPIDASAA